MKGKMQGQLKVCEQFVVSLYFSNSILLGCPPGVLGQSGTLVRAEKKPQ